MNKHSQFVRNKLEYACEKGWNLNFGRLIRSGFPRDISKGSANVPIVMSGDVRLARINSFSPGQNDRHSADDIFKCIILNDKLCISIGIPLMFGPKGPIDGNLALVQVMAWRRIWLTKNSSLCYAR